jgi:hypothetical protein
MMVVRILMLAVGVLLVEQQKEEENQHHQMVQYPLQIQTQIMVTEIQL